VDGEHLRLHDFGYLRHVPVRGLLSLATDMVYRATHRLPRSWERCVMGYHHPLTWCPRPAVEDAPWTACTKHLPLFPDCGGTT